MANLSGKIDSVGIDEVVIVEGSDRFVVDIDEGIKPFWEDRCVLITGATGYVGKVILAKLLCGDVGLPKKMFLMVRSKGDASPTERLQTALQSEAFQPCHLALSTKRSMRFDDVVSERVVAVAGDLNEPGLGMIQRERAHIVESCDVIINCAADVSFDEPLHIVRNTNIKSVNEMLLLANECHGKGGLKAFVHVSTCYVNANINGAVSEQIYSAPIDVSSFMAMSDDDLREQEDQILSTTNFPNTYSFTKNMAEQFLAKHIQESGSDLPLVIVRPAIIGCSLREPMPGWVDNVFGTGATLLLGGLGVLRYVYGNTTLVHDLVPLDTVVDAILGAAICVDELAADCGSVPVINCGTSSLKAVTIEQAVRAGNQYWSVYPSKKKQVRPCFLECGLDDAAFQKQTQAMDRQAWWLNRCSCTRNLGKKMEKCVRNVRRLDKLYRPFTTNEWIFVSDNLGKLPSLLAARGEPVNAYAALKLQGIDWDKYLRLYCYGLRHYVLGETDSVILDFDDDDANIDAPSSQDRDSAIHQSPIAVGRHSRLSSQGEIRRTSQVWSLMSSQVEIRRMSEVWSHVSSQVEINRTGDVCDLFTEA